MEAFKTVFSGKTQDILDRAYEAVEYFNYKNSKERFMAALEEATTRGGHEWYAKNG
jgi:hypothetical protein